MKNPIQLTKAITPVRHLLRHSPWRRYLLVIPLVLVSFALSPIARAVDPPPDGGYPGFNTAEGDNALFENAADFNTAIGYSALWFNRLGEPVPVTGGNNTASGAFSLASNTSGTDNTASGFDALYSNTEGGFNTANGSQA